MNELDLIRDLRADVGCPTPEQLAAGRERLWTTIGGSPRAERLRHRSSRARYLRGAVAAAAVGAAVAVAVEVHGTNPASAPAAPPTAHVRLADQLLRAAAGSLATQPGIRPSLQQWIYSAFLARTIGQATQSDEGWTRFDGRQTAYIQSGRLIVHTSPVPPSGFSYPMGAYDALASLPSDPQALLGAVDRAIAANPSTVAPPGASPISDHQTRRQLEFQFLTQLLWQAAQAAPARGEAAAYRALATIPGVTVRSGISDAVGRRALALCDAGDEQQLLLDPRTYKVIGLRTISNGTWPVSVMAKGHGPSYPSGTVIESDAWVQIALVSGPGER